MKQPSKKSGVLLVPLFYLLLLAVWQSLASLPHARDYVFPSPLSFGPDGWIGAQSLAPFKLYGAPAMGIGFAAMSAAIGLVIRGGNGNFLGNQQNIEIVVPRIAGHCRLQRRRRFRADLWIKRR